MSPNSAMDDCDGLYIPGMRSVTRSSTTAVLIATALVLSACGGDDAGN